MSNLTKHHELQRKLVAAQGRMHYLSKGYGTMMEGAEACALVSNLKKQIATLTEDK